MPLKKGYKIWEPERDTGLNNWVGQIVIVLNTLWF